jgi:hypothetical protein
MSQRLPLLEQVKPNTPLRLSVAAALAFPDGSMTASGLRRLLTIYLARVRRLSVVQPKNPYLISPLTHY